MNKITSFVGILKRAYALVSSGLIWKSQHYDVVREMASENMQIMHQLNSLKGKMLFFTLADGIAIKTTVFDSKDIRDIVLTYVAVFPVHGFKITHIEAGSKIFDEILWSSESKHSGYELPRKICGAAVRLNEILADNECAIWMGRP